MTFGIGQLIIYTLVIFVYGFNWHFLISACRRGLIDDAVGLAFGFNLIVTGLIVALVIAAIVRLWSVPIPS